MPAEPIAKYVITAHAAFEMARRGISGETVSDAMTAPEQRLWCAPAEVVTAYATSKIAKYWSPES